MSLAKKTRDKVSEQEYLDGELISEVKHEYIDGFVYAMAGASEKHCLISGNIFYKFSEVLRKEKSPCKVLSESMKVRISDKGTQYFYPDVLVFCDNHKEDTQYYKNSPVILVEVLSNSTRKSDLFTKKLYYFNIPTLQEYVIIEQNICQVTVFKRSDNWNPTIYILGDSITFESIGVTLSVEDIYYQVDNDEIAFYLKYKDKETPPED